MVLIFRDRGLVRNVRTVCTPILNTKGPYISVHSSDPNYKDRLYLNIEYEYLATTTLYRNVRTCCTLILNANISELPFYRNIRTICTLILNANCPSILDRLECHGTVQHGKWHTPWALYRTAKTVCTLILNTNGLYSSDLPLCTEI